MELTLTLLRGAVATAPEERRSFREDLVIGRGVEAGWRLADPARVLSKLHCALELRGGVWRLRDLSTNGTYLNRAAEPVGRDRVVPLADGDRLRLGGYEIEVRIGAAVPAPAAAEEPAAEALSPAVAAPGPQPAPAPAPAPAHAPAPAPGAALPAAALAPLLEGAGLSPLALAGADPATALRAAGESLRAAVAGLRALLITRADAKRAFRIEQTMLKRAGNNPLKFSATEEAALVALLGPQRMPGAVAATVADLRAHHLATRAATQAALRALLDRLSPERIEATDPGGGFLGGREKRLWDAYAATYRQLNDRLEDDFESAFGKAFARSYEEAARRERLG